MENITGRLIDNDETMVSCSSTHECIIQPGVNMWLYRKQAHTWLILLLWFLIDAILLLLLFLLDRLIMIISVQHTQSHSFWFSLFELLVLSSFLFDMWIFCVFFSQVLRLFLRHTLFLLIFYLLLQFRQQRLRPRRLWEAPIFLISKVSVITPCNTCWQSQTRSLLTIIRFYLLVIHITLFFSFLSIWMIWC